MRKSRSPLKHLYHVLLVPLSIGLVLQQGCSGFGGGPASDAPARSATEVLRLATTTSTRDSGLLDELLPAFEKGNGCRVDVVAVGTGAALKLGEAGDADVVMVHARKAEEAFMAARHGVRHEEFMYNDFVFLGPQNDPAQIRDIDPVTALTRIAERGQQFVSRGDDSGTHKRELSLWEQGGGRPEWDEYIESGQGMGPTLVIADEKQAYVLADMGTYLNFRDKVELVPLTAPAQSLRNPYAVIAVNPDKHERVNDQMADALVDFLIGEEAQRLIAGYQVAGQQLFHPTRLDHTN